MAACGAALLECQALGFPGLGLQELRISAVPGGTAASVEVVFLMGKEVKRGRHGPHQLPEVVTPPAALTPPSTSTSTSMSAGVTSPASLHLTLPVSVSSAPASVPPVSEPSAAVPGMSWPLAVVMIVTIAIGFAFAFLMIAVVGMNPWGAAVITMALVAAIVSALIPRPGDGGGWRRIANVIHALGDGSGGSGGAR